MIDRAVVVVSHLLGRARAAAEALGCDVVYRYWSEHPVRMKLSGLRAESFDIMFTLRRIARRRPDSSTTRLWAVMAATLILLILTIACGVYAVSQILPTGMQSVM